jgi:trypsin
MAARRQNETSDDEMQKRLQIRVKAARDYARALAGSDNAEFVKRFQEAFNLAVVDLEHPAAESPGTERALRFREDVRAPEQLVSDPTYVENAVNLIRNTARIVGGVTTNAFPDCVLIGTEGGPNDFCCTGTLVARNVVVTAGHCHGGCSDRIFIGPRLGGPGEIVRASNAVRHPDFDDSDPTGVVIKNDLTVLILERDVTSVQPRKMATSDMINAATSVRAVGYGNSNRQSTSGFGVKRMVDIPVVSVGCAKTSQVNKFGCVKNKELVAGKPLLNKDTCNGDSGGPIYVRSGGQFFLAGATSRAIKGSIDPCGDGGIYVRIDKYANWIRLVPGGHWQ